MTSKNQRDRPPTKTEMSQTINHDHRAGQQGLPQRMVLLAGIMVAAGVVIGSLGIFGFGTSVTTFTIAWIACTASALLAHVFGEYPQGDYNFAARMALQMVVRTVPPFAVAICCIKFVEPPLETSLVFYILSFYMIGLAADIKLQLGSLATRQESQQ